MSFTPSVKQFGTIVAKIATNWKFVQVSGNDQVCVCMYDTNNVRIFSTTPIVKAQRKDSVNGSFVVTESGSIYFLADSEKHGSLWEMGIQMKRPEVYLQLKNNNIL